MIFQNNRGATMEVNTSIGVGRCSDLGGDIIKYDFLPC